MVDLYRDAGLRPVRGLFVSLFSIGLLCISAHDAPAQVPVLPVAVSGQPAPQGDGVFANFVNPMLNTQGQVAFTADLLLGGTVTSQNNQGLWGGLPGTLGLVAREGAQAPGTIGTDFSFFDRPILSDNGVIAFTATLRGVPSSGNTGIWSGTIDAPSLVFQKGQLIPGFTDRTFTGFSSLRLAGDHLAFLADELVGFFPQDAIWAGPAGTLRAIVREGDPAPGPGVGAYVNIADLAVSPAGQTLITSSARRSTGSGFRGGLWSEQSGSLTVVALRSDPQSGNITPFGTIGSSAINSAGQVAFLSSHRLDSDGIRKFGVWAGPTNNPQPVIMPGDDARGPGTADFLNTSDVVINASGTLAFAGTLEIEPGGATLDDDHALWVGQPAALQMVARESDTAPGADATFRLFDTPTLNAFGDAVFTASLTLEPGKVEQNNDRGLWAYHNQQLRLLLRDGDEIDIDPTTGIDLRTIAAIGFTGGTGGEDGLARGFNDDGLVVVKLTFTDNTSGIFTAVVPEPGTLITLLLLPTLLSMPGRSGQRR